MRVLHHIGIDQTGAISSRGIPKPLPMCILSGYHLRLAYLKHFTKASFLEHLSENDFVKSQILVDCVLGLPRGFNWSKEFKKAASAKDFGQKAAAKFFFKIGQGQPIFREIDKIFGAQSVFLEKPYQKNIQTGTYRIWKELSADEKWYRFPHLKGQESDGGVPIYEGYPSLAWKIVFKLNQREPQKLTDLIKDRFPKIKWTKEHSRLIEKDSNMADAVLLALLSKFHRDTSAPHPEGWIYKGNSSLFRKQCV